MSLARSISLVCLLAVWCTAHAADLESPHEAQHELIDAALDQFLVEPAPPARVFFLGFAGYGEERVFAEEIKLAADRVAAKFGTGQRSLLLINDRRDLSRYPLATHDNLRYALREMGRRMNPESDLLFLVLSSHGAHEAMIEVSNTGMEPVGLSAPTLALFLESAGIRNRIIVMSACFSGAFIEPLANNDSIVLTASSKSRSSFGCNDERHLTYFGEALFQDALPGAATLRAAFEAARRDIRRREKQERFKPSQPQSYFGPLIESRLDELMAAREKKGPTPDR